MSLQSDTPSKSTSVPTALICSRTMNRKGLFLTIVVGTILISTIASWMLTSKRQSSAVVTNGLECASMASGILDAGGSVADAAITALLCEGITCPQSAGLGGGFVMTIFIKEANKVETLIARDQAPLAATENMFVNVSKVTGGKAIAVPGELKGYWELHQKYGKLPWARLFDPVIELCRNGHVVSPYLAGILNRSRKVVMDSPSLKAVFVNPNTGDVYKEGDHVKRLKLADTFEIIQTEGVDSIYGGGTIGQRLLEDIKEMEGIITADDFAQYNVRWEAPSATRLQNKKTVYSTPLPTSGPLVAFMMNVLDGFLRSGESTVVSLQRIAEAFKYAYAERTGLGDSRFFANASIIEKRLVDASFAAQTRGKISDHITYNDYSHYGAHFASQPDHGTAHINILGFNGDAISATTTINTPFGAKIVSNQTGIILNDGMDDFAVPGINNKHGIPPSPANFIRPRKIPLSSMCPAIVLDEADNVELLIGGAGGSKITSSVVYVLARYMYFNESLWDAVHAPRIHHQLVPMQLVYEKGFRDDVIDGLTSIGHKMHPSPSDIGFASLTAIRRNGDEVSAIYDPRRKGSVCISNGKD